MARAIFQNIGGGGGGGSSEDCTATKDKVLTGYTAVTSDSNDEPVTGTMPNLTRDSSITSYPSNLIPVILGKDAYVGQCSDNITRALILFSGTGGYIESGTCIGVEQSEMAQSAGVTANKILYDKSILGVAGTATYDATASSKYIYNGKTAYVKGYKVTGTMTVNSILSFDYAAYSTTQIIVKWQNPSKGPFSGVVICAKTGGYPTSPDDNRKYTGYGDNKNASAWSNAIISGLTPGTTYYFRMWWYATCSAGDMFSSSAKQFTCATIASGRKVFTSSTTWTVPTGVKSIKIHCTGGGASGGTSDKSNNASMKSGGGGGGGYCSYKTNIAVTPGETLTITVGTGGVHANNGGCIAGNLSSVYRGGTALCIGNGGASSSKRYGSNGGSGGGAGASLSGYDVTNAGSGGSNGANGGGEAYYTGKGQGTSTREFGASSGTLYSGGGGAGAAHNWVSSSDSEQTSPAGSGGAGGGASGGGESSAGANGSAGTGGGGGGGGVSFVYGQKVGGNGGSGCVIIAW